MDVTIGKMVLTDCDVDIILKRYTQKFHRKKQDGDDVKDLGRMSYEFIVTGHIDMDDFKILNKQANRKSNKFAFDLGEFMVVTKLLEFKSSGEYTLHVIEDIKPEKD